MVFLFHVMHVGINLLLRIRPVHLQKRLLSILFFCYSYLSRGKSVLFQILLPVFVVSGETKNSNETIDLLFVGRDNFPLFLSNLIFIKKPNIKKLGSVFVWRLKQLNQFPFNDEAILVSVDRFYERWLRKNNLYVFPHLVDMVVDVSNPLDDFYYQLPNSAKSDVRKVRKNEFSYEIVNDPELLKFFYNSMFLPLIKNRYHNKPMFTPPLLYLIVLQKISYQLLIVKDKTGKLVSGCFFNTKKDEIFSRYNGVLNGDFNLIRKGAESALYYFLIDWAKKQGFKNVDFGYCRPFKKDGVYQYKNKWGAEMRRSSGFDTPLVFGLKIIKENGILQDFFDNNPFYAIDKNNRFIEYSELKR